MADHKDDVKKGTYDVLSDVGLARRRLLRHAAWVAPAIVGTAAVRARAQTGSCPPLVDPPCSPIVD